MSFKDCLPELIEKVGSWKPVFEKARDELEFIASKLDERKTRIVPDKELLFRAFELTPLEKVRVVIVGQDPYPSILSDNTSRAQGLAFSVREDDTIPSSLLNIFKEIKNEYPGWEAKRGGDLTHWAKQGVLLLNACLTCDVDSPRSHSKYYLWLPFIKKVIKEIEEVNPKCIFVFWGRESKRLIDFLNDSTIKLISAHPSGLSAHRGFFGNNHFKTINQLLGENQIEW